MLGLLLVFVSVIVVGICACTIALLSAREIQRNEEKNK